MPYFKQLPILLLFFCLRILEPGAYAACSGASPSWMAASANRSDVSACVALATAGDIITVPAGNATWTAPIVVTVGITIDGNGIGSTIITDNGTAWAGLFTVNVPDSQRFVLSNIEFSAGPSQVHFNAAGGIIVIDGSAQDYMKFRIHHTKWTGMNGYALRIKNVYGLIDNNIFIDQQNGATSVFVSGDGPAAFNRALAPGGAYAVFVEDNTFNCAVAYSAWLEQWNATRVVVRHNIFENTWISSHGYQDVDAAYRGPVLIEYYNNIADCNDNTGPYYCHGGMDIRGGAAVIFNNTWTETSGATFSNTIVELDYYGLWDRTDNACYPGTKSSPRCLLYPCMDQPGRMGITQMPVYIWNNTYAGIHQFLLINPDFLHDGYNCTTIPRVYNQAGQCASDSAVGSCFIKENRDYYLRPPQSGDPYYPYISYTYPHPLRSSLNPPQNLRIIM